MKINNKATITITGLNVNYATDFETITDTINETVSKYFKDEGLAVIEYNFINNDDKEYTITTVNDIQKEIIKLLHKA